MTQLTPSLHRLGDLLERAAAADLAARSAPRSRRPRRLLLAAAAIVAVASASGAIAAALTSGSDVSQSMVAGDFIFGGTQPTCTVVTKGVEFHCVLSKPPYPEVTDFKGSVFDTVDATQHVNGGCRGLSSDGLTWECYLGQAAVDQQIIDQGFLGETQTTPGHG
jgi:hypothetical protein